MQDTLHVYAKEFFTGEDHVLYVLETNAFGAGDGQICYWRQKNLVQETKAFRAGDEP